MTASKIVAAAASGAGSGATLDVDQCFSTFLYEGNGGTQTITNGIDLTEGGLVWSKDRDTATYHSLTDTERGGQYALYSSATDAQVDRGTDFITSFNSNGYSLGADGLINDTYSYVSWTFRKASKFFQCIQYSGNSTAGRTISHNLGCTVGQVWVKRTSHANNWICWHRGIANNKYLQLNSTSQAYADGGIFWNNTTPSSETVTLGSDSAVNATGSTYVMYVFAHNNNDGGFGPDGDQDIIKCGSYTGSSSAQEINVGFEPQFILQKRTDGTSPWRLHDIMRGMPVGSDDAYLAADSTAAEADYNVFSLTPTGFRIDYSSPYYNTSGGSYIYMAIRRGPLAIPEDATKVFNIETRGATAPNPPAFNADFDPDFGVRGVPNDTYSLDRLTSGSYMRLSSNGAKTNSSTYTFDFSRGFFNNSSTSTSDYGYMWRRAPSYFDVVGFLGTGNARTLPHGLTVPPEMIWFKKRSGVENWIVYHKDLTGGSYPSGKNYLFLNDNNTVETSYQPLTSAPTSSGLPLSASSGTNQSGQDYIAYLFATAPGVSKVGSYTGNGSSQNIDCGFSNGSRLIIIKNIDNPRPWHLFDTARGISTGNVTSHQINDSSGLTADCIDPLSSGFTVNSTANMTNINNIKYIFYAIA